MPHWHAYVTTPASPLEDLTDEEYAIATLVCAAPQLALQLATARRGR